MVAPHPRVIGRDTELRVVDEVLGGLPAGSAALVIQGEPGIGKTTIWNAAIDRAQAMGARVLAARAAAAERNLTLATLADLLGLIIDDLPVDLPGPQRRALDVALLRVDANGHGTGDERLPLEPRDPRLLGAAVRAVLAELAAAGPVLIAIDDAQWADAASAMALAYAVRRLADRPIGLLLAARSDERLPFDLRSLVADDNVRLIDVGPLTVAALHHLLKERTGRSPSRALLVRIHEACGGSPLFALEIAGLLDAAAQPRPGEPLPVPPDVRDLLRRRIRGLPRSTREVLLHAAALGRSPVALLERALERSIGPDLDAAEAADVATVEHEQLVFRHPLLAGVMYGDATAPTRAATHRRLATVVDGEERVRHRALGAEGPDEEVAEELVAAARAALGRAAPAAAADLMALALTVMPPADQIRRLERTVELAGYLKRAGDTDGAARRLEQVVAEAPAGHIRARARLGLAALHHETDQPAVAARLAEAAIADAAGDDELLARAHAVLAAVDWDDHARRRVETDEAYRLLETLDDPDPEVVGLVLMGRLEQDIDTGRGVDPDLVRRGLEAERRSAAVNVADRFSAALGAQLKYVDDLDGARRWIEHTYQAAVDEGDEGSLPYAISHLPEVELWVGNWPEAEIAARRHLELALEFGLESQRRQALYNLGLVLAHRGRLEEAQAVVEDGLAAAAADDDAWTTTTMTPILGFIELSRGNLPAAVRHLRRGAALRDTIGQVSPRRQDPDLVEALVGIGAIPEARGHLGAIAARAERSRRPSALAAAARARALVAGASGDLEAGLANIQEALADQGRPPYPFDRARSLLVLGQLRRRRRERRKARAAFEEARAIFERLGAPTWVARAEAELARVGLRQAPAQLTESERRVAELAAAGMTNREAAAALFVSPKTIEANLSRVYAKLGVRSRAQLAQALGSVPGSTATEPSAVRT
ncbi:MAG: AAA family ATPase [Chloroflexi bacterium]|nr:AAA family ATPase [Chloroflexota bacterium]